MIVLMRYEPLKIPEKFNKYRQIDVDLCHVGMLGMTSYSTIVGADIGNSADEL